MMNTRIFILETSKGIYENADTVLKGTKESITFIKDSIKDVIVTSVQQIIGDLQNLVPQI